MVTSSARTADRNPEFAREDLHIGQLLGKGSFSDVHELVIRSRPEHRDVTYAVKFLRKTGKFTAAAEDLEIERKLLTNLQHENIIQLHGFYYDYDRKQYLFLDLLYGTLEDRIRQWRFEGNKKLPRYMAMVMPRIMEHCLSESQKLQLTERIHSVALPIAKALEYLHFKNIIFRDVKPRNIGFDARGTAKLFDFGLARDVRLYRFKGKAGSPLYMAPEVALSEEEYGLPADVYSFTMTLWELVTLKTPFEQIKRRDHERLVIKGNLRPRVDYNCGSPRLQKLMSNGWTRSPDLRPTFSTIVTTLDAESKSATPRAYQKSLSLAHRVRAAY